MPCHDQYLPIFTTCRSYNEVLYLLLTVNKFYGILKIFKRIVSIIGMTKEAYVS